MPHHCYISECRAPFCDEAHTATARLNTPAPHIRPISQLPEKIHSRSPDAHGDSVQHALPATSICSVLSLFKRLLNPR